LPSRLGATNGNELSWEERPEEEIRGRIRPA
jgi:hypothetical protein